MMGGSGSGRGGGRSTIGRTRSYQLSMRQLRDLLRLGHSGFRLTFRSDRDEVTVEGRVDTRGSTPHVRLHHTTRC